MFKYSHTAKWRARRIAEARVKRGIVWLDGHAPRGWKYHLFDVPYLSEDGRLVTRVRFDLRYNNEDLLARAFEAHPALSYPQGFVIAQHFKIDMIEHGFEYDALVSIKLLTEVWCEAIIEYVHGFKFHKHMRKKREQKAA